MASTSPPLPPLAIGGLKMTDFFVVRLILTTCDCKNVSWKSPISMIKILLGAWLFAWILNLPRKSVNWTFGSAIHTVVWLIQSEASIPIPGYSVIGQVIPFSQHNVLASLQLPVGSCYVRFYGYTMYGVSWTLLGLPLNFFHFDFVCIGVHPNSTESL